MPRIWISNNKPGAVTELLRSDTGKAVFPGKTAHSAFSCAVSIISAASLTIAVVLGLTGCASNSTVSRKAPVTAPVVASRPAPVQVVSAPVTPDPRFMSSNIASEASEFIRLGRGSMADSAWFEASEYLDSAMVHLAVLETFPSLSPRQKMTVEIYQDSVREWLVEAVSQ